VHVDGGYHAIGAPPVPPEQDEQGSGGDGSPPSAG